MTFSFSHLAAAFVLTLSFMGAPVFAQIAPSEAEPVIAVPDMAEPVMALPERSQPVPVTANFSPAELATIAVIYPTSMILITSGGRFIAQPTPSMTGALPGSIDYRLSERTHGDLETGAPWLGGVPDKAAYALGIGSAAYYGLSSVYRLATGENAFAFQGPHLYHSALGFAEAYAWTALVTTGAKFLVGRPRPYVALERPGYAWSDHEENLSFFSGHASLGFAAASYLSLDISDGLYHRILADRDPATRYLVGKILPFSVLYGTATAIAYSRIYDQKHYLSDVLTGAIVGTLIGNLVYVVHFDAEGRPRERRQPRDGAPRLSWEAGPSIVKGTQSSAPGWRIGFTW